MTYLEYKNNVIDKTEETKNLKLTISYMWVPAHRMPRGVVSLLENATEQVIKIPERVETQPDCFVPIDTIFSHAFENNENVTDIIFSKNIRSIGEFAFKNCSSLKRIFLPKGLKSIGKHAFEGCELEDIYYEGTREDFSKFITMKEKQDRNFGALESGSPVERLISDSSIYYFENIELLYTKVHFNVSPDQVSTPAPSLTVKVDGKDVTDLFKTN